MKNAQRGTMPFRRVTSLLAGVALFGTLPAARATSATQQDLPSAERPVRSGRSRVGGVSVPGLQRSISENLAVAHETLRFEVESRNLEIGDVIPDQEFILQDALAVRVFSTKDWSLKLDSNSIHSAEGNVPSISRLSWRNGSSSAFHGISPGGSVIARGRATGDSGQLVVVDLRLLLASEDPLGNFHSDLRLSLEAAMP